jgi:2-isopropylmalate synthase
MGERILVFDTTLRDGEQSPGCSMNLEEKLRMAGQLEALGVDVIEAGFPIASDDDFKAVREVSRRCQRATVAALARALPEDIERAWAALRDARRPRIHTFLATSDIHLEYKLKISRDQALQQIDKAVRLAASHTADVEFSPEDATRTELDFLCKAVEAAIAAGATTINIPDTVGYTIPREFVRIIETLTATVPGFDRITLSVHCHNDLGLAVANTIAAIESGARQVECTINGIGERAGNASLEEIVMALKVRRDELKYSTGINSEEIFPASQMLSNITGVTVQPNKAIVGRNAFAHEAGIHQHGVLANSLTYEIMRPEMVGAKRSTLVLGKHSGRHALRKRCEELGYDISDDMLGRVYKTLTALADVKKEICDDDLIAILEEGAPEIPETYKLRSVEAMAGSSKTSWASVTLEKDGKIFSRTCQADGPVTAVCASIDFLTGFKGRLIDYAVHSVTPGAESISEVKADIEFGDSVFTGRGASGDVIEASALAYLSAVNKAVVARNRLTGRRPSGRAVFTGAAD